MPGIETLPRLFLHLREMRLPWAHLSDVNAVRLRSLAQSQRWEVGFPGIQPLPRWFLHLREMRLLWLERPLGLGLAQDRQDVASSCFVQMLILLGLIFPHEHLM